MDLSEEASEVDIEERMTHFLYCNNGEIIIQSY